MPNASVLTAYGAPEVLVWMPVDMPQPGPGQIRIRVRAAGISPTDPKIRRGDLAKVFPMPPNAVLGFEAAGVVDALGDGATGVSVGDEVVSLLPALGGYGEYALTSAWTPKPEKVSWVDAAALPSSAEASLRVLRKLHVQPGETLLILGGGGSVGMIATQLAVEAGVNVISATGQRDQELAGELRATPVVYGPDLYPHVREHVDQVDAVFDASGHGGSLADAIKLAGGKSRVQTISDEAAAEFGLSISVITPDAAPDALAITLPKVADGTLRLRSHRVIAFDEAARAHALLESGEAREKIVLAVA